MRLLGGILYDFGPTYVETIFAGILIKLKEKGSSLAAQTRRAAVLGAMLRDLESMGYQPATPLFAKCVQSVAAFLTSGDTASVDPLTRCDAAQALGRLGDPRLRLPQDQDYWVCIPACQFTMGEGKDDDETPHQVHLDAYRIGRYPVSVQEYALFLAAESTHQPPPAWTQQRDFPNRPVVSVTWHDAQAYCQLGHQAVHSEGASAD